MWYLAQNYRPGQGLSIELLRNFGIWHKVQTWPIQPTVRYALNHKQKKHEYLDAWMHTEIETDTATDDETISCAVKNQMEKQGKRN